MKTSSPCSPPRCRLAAHLFKLACRCLYLCCAVTAAITAPGAFAAAVATPSVVIAQGQLQGTVEGGVNVFKGVPYALAPTGSHRWLAPAPHPGWSGRRDATSFAPDCIQQPYASGSFFDRLARPTSEDCLYLNVWSEKAGGQRPVMVWLHGGGLTRGSGASPWYNGANLARKGVVLVTINYRLGAFGYLAHRSLARESAERSAGNYGMLDQIMALGWVRDNISAFGGDPANVTIFGESAGSWSVNTLLASPRAAGLFHKAIGQSGGQFGAMSTLPEHMVMGKEFAQLAGAKNLKELRDLPAHKVLETFAEGNFRAKGLARSNVDGWVLPDQVGALFRAGNFNKVPVIVGFNADEGTNLAAHMTPTTESGLMLYVRKRYGARFAREFAEVYDVAGDFQQAFLDSYRDAAFGWQMQTWADLATQHGSNAWLYYFDYAPSQPGNGRFGAYHGADIRYVFNNAGSEPRDVALADLLSDYWVSFAKTGQPSARNGLEWPGYEKTQQNYLHIGDETRVGRALLAKKLRFHSKVDAARRLGEAHRNGDAHRNGVP